MGNNTQSRKWSLVINDPQECGLDHSAIVEILRKFSPAYFCMADEIATTGTYHTHIFLYSPSPISRDYNAEETMRAQEQGREPVLLPHFSAHNLRHTFCTRFCENETNLKVIQEIMGHADISTTMNIYNEATKEKKIESFANLEGKIKIS